MEILSLSNDDLLALVTDIAVAEAHDIPGPAREAWVIASALGRKTHSPPPVWIWLLMKMLELVVPEILDWLKKRYGEAWPAHTLAAVKQGKLPWQNS